MPLYRAYLPLERGEYTSFPCDRQPTATTLARLAILASFKDPTSYGSSLRKFHIFCDVFSIPEIARPPASTELVYSFLLCVSDPDTEKPIYRDGTIFESVSIATARKYMSAIRAWHIAQDWPPPLSESSNAIILAGIRGMENIQAANGQRRRPPRPPVTIVMMYTLRAVLNLADPFDACLWAQCTCAFFGLMRFGEASVKSRAAFDKAKHLTRQDLFFGTDLNGTPCARLHLPSAKTAKAGETQDVFLVEEEGLCTIAALHNLIRLYLHALRIHCSRGRTRQCAPDRKSDISVQDQHHPVCRGLLQCLRALFPHRGLLPRQGRFTEIVCIHGRWKSLAYEVIASTRLANRVGNGPGDFSNKRLSKLLNFACSLPNLFNFVQSRMESARSWSLFAHATISFMAAHLISDFFDGNGAPHPFS
ncbi:hypothetical protein BDZ97DRAFT_1664423 [Flammula alnicola]|nr:hypothetical protein BDZ97DRAFT_1664423 [Flammula alnicola]